MKRRPPTSHAGARLNSPQWPAATDSRSLPYYLRLGPIDPSLDVRLLSPGFETVRQTLLRNAALIERLDRIGEHHIADNIRGCRNDSWCLLPACARCGMMLRIAQGSDCLRLLNAHRADGVIINANLRRVAEGELEAADLDAEHNRLRTQLDRAGFRGSLLIGGTEIAWKRASRTWLVHVHLLAIGASEASIKELRAFHGPRDIKVQPIRHPASQLSYLQKFETFHRPGIRTGQLRPRVFPLPPGELREWVRFVCHYRLEDFQFLYGLRRFGTQLKATRKEVARLL